jgi:hypothetical protein
MAEPLPESEPEPSTTYVDPAESERLLAQKNLAWGWALLGLFIALFGGTVLIAYAYLWLD